MVIKGMKRKVFPFDYLGVLLVKRKPKVSYLRPIVDKKKSRLRLVKVRFYLTR